VACGLWTVTVRYAAAGHRAERSVAPSYLERPRTHSSLTLELPRRNTTLARSSLHRCPTTPTAMRRRVDS